MKWKLFRAIHHTVPSLAFSFLSPQHFETRNSNYLKILLYISKNKKLPTATINSTVI